MIQVTVNLAYDSKILKCSPETQVDDSGDKFFI